MTSYKIDFYRVSLNPTADTPSPRSGFLSILSEEIKPFVPADRGYARELYGLVRRTGNCLGGVLRKFRTDNLPTIGAPGEDAEDLPLDDDEAVIEQNHFVYYPEHDLIGWQIDRHGTHPRAFSDFLSSLWGTEVKVNPVVQPDAIRRLMAGSVELKKIHVSVPRPTNPAMFAEDDFSTAMLLAMSNAEADSIHFDMGVDLRRNRQARLSARMKTALQNLQVMGATTARAEVIEGGLEHTIDLIADRVSSRQDAETEGRLAPESMYRLIDAAKAECSEALNEYFGTRETALS